MTQPKWVTLVVLACIIAWMILTQVWLAYSSQKLSQKILQAQIEINQARQKDALTRQIVLRLAQEAQQNRSLQDLMKKRDLKINYTQDGVQKTFPE